jgi:hypothetical protein
MLLHRMLNEQTTTLAVVVASKGAVMDEEDRLPRSPHKDEVLFAETALSDRSRRGSVWGILGFAAQLRPVL